MGNAYSAPSSPTPARNCCWGFPSCSASWDYGDPCSFVSPFCSSVRQSGGNAASRRGFAATEACSSVPRRGRLTPCFPWLSPPDWPRGSGGWHSVNSPGEGSRFHHDTNRTLSRCEFLPDILIQNMGKNGNELFSVNRQNPSLQEIFGKNISFFIYANIFQSLLGEIPEIQLGWIFCIRRKSRRASSFQLDWEIRSINSWCDSFFCLSDQSF